MSNPVYAIVSNRFTINKYVSFLNRNNIYQTLKQNIQFSAFYKLKGYNSVIKIINKQSSNQLKHKINKQNINYQKY